MTDRRDDEKQYQRTVVETLETFGYEVSHSYPLQTKHGWRTGNTAKGWPDLVAVRPPRLLAIEIKVPPNRVPDEQRAWLTLFSEIPCARAWVLRPTDDWSLTVQWIRHPVDAPTRFGFDPVDDPVAVLGRTRRRRR